MHRLCLLWFSACSLLPVFVMAHCGSLSVLLFVLCLLCFMVIDYSLPFVYPRSLLVISCSPSVYCSVLLFLFCYTFIDYSVFSLFILWFLFILTCVCLLFCSFYSFRITLIDYSVFFSIHFGIFIYSALRILSFVVFIYPCSLFILYFLCWQCWRWGRM